MCTFNYLSVTKDYVSVYYVDRVIFDPFQDGLNTLVFIWCSQNVFPGEHLPSFSFWVQVINRHDCDQMELGPQSEQYDAIF